MDRKERLGSLDMPIEELRERLYDAVDMAVGLYDGVEQKKLFASNSPEEVKALFDEPLPSSPSDIGALLRRVERDVFKHSTLNISPNFYAYVVSGGNHAGLIAELLASALNQNPGKWNLGAAAVELELRVVRWIAEFIGYDPAAAGVLVSGGSAANLTCLKAARDFKAGFEIQKKGSRAGAPLTMYVSTEGHSCLAKSADMLGLGKESLRKIPVNEDFTIDLEQLERTIAEDKSAGFVPFCVIGNGGTVNTGAVDPLALLAGIALRHNMWFHVDAAYGGPAASTESGRELFAGLKLADSIATDAHKWLYAPYEAGVALVKDREALRSSFTVSADYLRDIDSTGRHDSTEYNFELSRNFKALKVWMAFKTYGAGKIRAAIEDNIQTIGHLGKLIKESPDFELLAPVSLSIACFRYRTGDPQFWNDDEYLSLLNKRILVESERDGRVFLSGTVIHGKQALRTCLVNHRTETGHVEYLVRILREVGQSVHTELHRVQQEVAT
jgi:glutamate/tyrosine decarboxylase-like PLP-dependent enzyme